MLLLDKLEGHSRRWMRAGRLKAARGHSGGSAREQRLGSGGDFECIACLPGNRNGRAAMLPLPHGRGSDAGRGSDLKIVRI